MLRRLLRVAAAGCCLLSLLACVGVGWLWWWSWRADGDRVACTVRRTRYTLASHRGRLTVLAPPPAPASAGIRRAVDDLAARLHNNQIAWVTFEGEERWDSGNVATGARASVA